MKAQLSRQALVGFIAGLATAALIVVLGIPPSNTSAAVHLSQPGPSPRSQSVVGSGPLSVSAGAVPQHEPVPLSAQARNQITPLEQRLEADPGDLVARKELAVILLENQQLMLAFQHASKILESQPFDPDGLYVQGVVRLAMGHAPRAMELLDKVLERYPGHTLALRARAEAQRKIREKGGVGLSGPESMAGARSKPQVDQLLAAASDGSLLEMVRGSTPASPDNIRDTGDGE